MNVTGTRCHWLLNVSLRPAARDDVVRHFVIVERPESGRLGKPVYVLAQGNLARSTLRPMASTCLQFCSNMRVLDTAQVRLYTPCATCSTVSHHSFVTSDSNERTFISSYLIYAMLFCLYPPEVLAPPRERKKRAQTATIAPMKKSF